MVDKPVLVDVIFTAGKVFENLRCDRQSTHAFITTGDLRGITSRADLELLSDLSDATEPLISFHNSGTPLTPEVIIAINKAMTRWGAIHPGQLRREHDIFGVPLDLVTTALPQLMRKRCKLSSTRSQHFLLPTPQRTCLLRLRKRSYSGMATSALHFLPQIFWSYHKDKF